MLALGKKSKSTLGIISEKKDCRPAITVDDLRKVKLKKATVSLCLYYLTEIMLKSYSPVLKRQYGNTSSN